MSESEIIDMLLSIRHYLMAGNPVWDTAKIDEAMTAAIEAVRREKRA